MREFLEGGTFSATSTLSKPVHEGSLADSPLIFDRGKWEIKNGEVCETYFQWQAGKTFCWAIATADGKNYYYADNGVPIVFVP
ncbi:MAG TPA: hypothetical protein VIJ42_13535 [Stellaceae bacterium]